MKTTMCVCRWFWIFCQIVGEQEELYQEWANSNECVRGFTIEV